MQLKKNLKKIHTVTFAKKGLNRELETPARDHSHFTGKFRGATHQSCNLQYKIEKKNYKLPVLFHNLRGYDSHHIFQKVKSKHGKIDVIPNNSERYVSFNIGKLKFLDSMQFLSSCIENLSAQLQDKDFTHISSVYSDVHMRKPLSKKGVYCYDYMNNMERFYESSLPSKDNFYNRLNNKHISD